MSSQLVRGGHVVQFREWPANVVPRHPPDVARAVELLRSRGQWNGGNQQALERVLEPWFADGWHVQAVLYALDYRPDGSPQARVGARETPDEFVKARLAHWYDESPDAESAYAKLPPPKPGLEFGEYLAIVQERRRRDGAGPATGLSARGEQARREALRRSRTRANPVQRRRAEDERVQAALDSLRVPGEPAPVPVHGRGDARPNRPSTRDIADFAGRRSLIRNDARVRRCAQEIAAGGGTPTREQLQVLRGAVLQARQSARLASLDASASELRLSPDAQRILDFVANVVDSDAPVDVMLAVLEQ